MAWKRSFNRVLGVLWLLFVVPLDARADPITAGILAIGAFLVTTTTGAAILAAAITTAVSLGVGAIQNALNRPKPIQAPRQDITISKSRFGEPIARVYKKFAVGGHIIWSGNYPTINDTTTTVGSGKRKQDIEGEYYSMSFGVMVCENIDDTVLGVTRVWLDNHLFYNVNDYGGGEAALDGTDQMLKVHTDPISGLPVEAFPNNVYGNVTYNSQSYVGKARNFRIALGNSAQTVSNVADWYVDEVGSTATPAYKGYVTLWWNDMDLRDYYNRLPTVKVEVLTSHDTLADIVAAECKLAGVASGDLSLTELEDIPSPGCFNDIAPPKSFFEALMFYRRFSLVNVDGDLKGLLIPRTPSNAPDGTSSVNNGLLGARQAGLEENSDQPPKFTFRTEQTGELPKHFELTFFDFGKNYEQASRPYLYPIGDATSTAQFYIPIAIGATDADGLPTIDAEMLLSGAAATTYSERSGIHLTLPPSFAQYHPGDVLTIPAPNNQLIDCRFQKMQYIPGQMVEVDAIRQIRKSNVGASTEDNPDNLPGATPGTGGGVAGAILETTYVLSNVPPLYDEHEMFAGIYGAAVPSVEQTVGTSWTGASFARNACGSDETYQEYQVIGHTDTAATIGFALTVLASATGTDTTNTVDIEFPYGQSSGIETILTQAWENSTTINLAILGKEVLQYKTVTDITPEDGNPTFRLSNFHRGLRDTVAFVGTHAEDEPFVLVTPQSVIRLPVNLDEHSQDGITPIHNWKCYTDGQTDLDVDPMTIVVYDGGDTMIKSN